LLTFNKRDPIRILVVRPDRVGDVVLSTPVFHTLKKSFENCFVGALVSSYTRPLLERNPNVDVIITDDPREEGPDDDFREKIKEIRSQKFDVALLLMPTKRLAYMLFLAGIPYRVGVGHILYEVLTMMYGVSRYKYNPLRHESEYMLDMVSKIGARERWTKPEIFLSEEEVHDARKYLEEKGFDAAQSVVCIHPGSGHSSPNWEAGRYAELAARLLSTGRQVLVTGSEGEKEFEQDFAGLGAGLRSSFGELSLREFAAVVANMGVFISSSTGPMHIAAAVGTPTVSMFCPLTACSPKLWGPLGNSSKLILPPDGFCQVRCPGDPHICRFEAGGDGISVESVFVAAKELLQDSEGRYLKDSSHDNTPSHRE
jgi:lipopolysaccharide heptosyltransferase II